MPSLVVQSWSSSESTTMHSDSTTQRLRVAHHPEVNTVLVGSP
jgi:hypothetical protein